MMTEDHKLKLRAGREAALTAKQRDEDRAARHYIDWTALEAESYGRYRAAYMGADEAAALRAYKHWRAVCADRPVPPPDAAFRRLRGE